MNGVQQEVPGGSRSENAGSLSSLTAPGLGPVVDFTSAADATLEHLHQRVGMDSWVIARHDGDDYVVLSALDGGRVGLHAGEVMRWSDTFCAATLAGDAPSFSAAVDQVPAWARARRMTGLPWRSYLSVPLRSPDGVVLGSLCAGARDEVSTDVGSLMSEVTLAADLLGTLLAYEVLLQREGRRAERAELAAARDALTGVGNRRAWDAALTAEESRARRLGSTASVLVVDLDALKVVNDTHGHDAGDALLVRTTRVLLEHLRPEDLVARLGGDEFAVLLPDVEQGAAREVLDRLRRGLQAAGVQASTGAATRQAGEGLHVAWQRADTAMYADKAARGEVAGDGLVATPADGSGAAGPGRDATRDAHADGPTRPAPPATGTTAGSAADADGEPGRRIEHLLDAVRRQLGMDAAVLACFDGDTWRLQHTATGPGVRDLQGFHCPRGDTYCQRLLDGYLQAVVPDTRADPVTAELALTRVLDIGAYAAAPVRLRDGTLYGTVCVVSSTSQSDLRARDAGVLEVLAEALGDLVTLEQQQNRRRREVLARLDRLHRSGGPRAVYQPVVDLRTLEPVGVEALSRFPEAGPAVWFAEAAAHGFGAELELAALAASLRRPPDVGTFLALNVSPALACSPSLGRALEGQRLDRIVLEITEHEQVQDYPALLHHLAPLRREGVRVAVDDAGAGFASLRHVLHLHPDFIKLDISLVHDIHLDTTRQALTASLTTFAQRTGAQLIAEGIENPEELECVTSLGVHLGQGFHLGHPSPSPLAEVPPLLRRP